MTTARRATAIVINHDPARLQFLSALLETEGLSVMACQRAEEALDLLRQRDSIDLIVTDLHLPEMDGWRFCRLLRSAEFAAFNSIPILVASETRPDIKTEQITTDLGASAFIALPCEPATVRACVQALLSMIQFVKEQTRKLRESEERYRMLIENQGEGLGMIDPDERFTFTNRAAEEIFGVSPGGLIGRSLTDFVRPEQLIVIQAQTEMRRDGKKSTYDLEITRPDGEKRQLLVTATPRFDGAGRYIGAFGIFLDITERKRAEQALRGSEAKFRGLFENVLEGVYQTTPDGKIISVNPALVRMLGYESEADLRAVNIGQDLYVHPEERKRMTDRLETRGELRNAELTLRRKDGRQIIVLENARAVRDDHGQVLYYEGTLTDITERKRADQALQELLENIQQAKEEWEITADSLPELVLLCDDRGRIIRANRTVEAWNLGRVAEMKGRGVHEFLHSDCPGTDCYLNAFWQQACQQAAHHQPASHEAYDDILKRHLQVWVRPSTTPTKRLAAHFTVVIVRDITERKRMEEELLKARKLESIGLLAGGIAHDFNNILMGILGNISVAKMCASPGDDLHNILVAAEKAALRAKDLTQQLLTFSKGGAPLKKTAAIAEIIKDSADFALRGSNVGCEFSIPETLWSVEVDEAQMSQVISNLIINADQAMPDGGVIRLRAQNVTVSAGDLSALKPGRYVKIAIEDHGIGIRPEHLPKIFDPYFTTKQKGTGLGLATAYSIIQKHDGHITVESQLGVGTVFTLYLPATVAETPIKTAAEAPPVVHQGYVLVMDDEDIVRDVTGKMLTKLGYDVVFARDGAEAIDAYRTAQANGQPFDVIIMDLTIPGGMGGKEAIKRLLDINPQAKVIVSSGYSNDPVMANFKDYGFCDVVAKPYKIQELSQALHRVISQPRSESGSAGRGS
jgi:PAS domain S-box-containing protein